MSVPSPTVGAGSPAAGEKSPKKKVEYEEAPLDKFCVPSVGKQWQSKRASAPMYSISKCTRQHREKVFISKEASASQLSPDVPGAIYEVHSTLNLSTGQKFGKGPQRTFGRWKNKYDYETRTTDLIQEVTPIANEQRYKRQASVVFGQTPIGLTNNIEILKAHPVAFQGLDSPGPALYPKPIIESTSKYKSWPKMPFGVKTDIGSMYNLNKNSNFPNIGPNSYPPMVSLGKQALSKRRNASTHAFPRAPKFGRGSKNADAGSNAQLNLSSLGKQVRGGKKTEPLVGFSRGTRTQAARITRCMTALDSATPSVKQHLPHPSIAQESQIIAYSGSMGTFS